MLWARTTGVPRDRPERPGVAAIVAELDVRRHALTALAVALIISAVVFLRYVYLPGTEEPVAFWFGLSFVLAFGVFVLVLVGLVARTAYRRTRSADDSAGSGFSPTSIALLVALAGWIGIPVFLTIVSAADPTTLDELPILHLVWASSGTLVVGSVGIRLVSVFSVDHRWHLGDATLASITYSAVVFVPSVGDPLPRLGTPDSLVASPFHVAVGVDPLYAITVLGGGVVIGAILALGGVPASHAVVAGTVATVSTLPIVAATTTDSSTVRTTSLFLPVVLGSAGLLGAIVSNVIPTFQPESTDESGQ